MPLTSIASLDVSGAQFPWATAGVELTWTAADVANKNECPATSQMLLIAWNSGASTRNVTVTSVPDTVTGRSGDITKALAAGKYWVWKLVTNGWAYSDNGVLKYRFEADHADVKFAILKLAQ